MKAITTLLLVLISMFGFTVEAKVCKKGQPCGNSCISWKKTCRVGSYSKNSNSFSSYNFQKKKESKSLEWVAVKYIVIANKLNVRDNPFVQNNNIIGTLNKGDTVVVHSLVSDWALITYNSGYAWVNQKHIKIAA
ncbi:SH3 domain-containing protein [Vibrio parahaemolyticus]|uniref:SH3 domain-containing protein n=1 Tax=Vibrio parahaemolyticus TaxID=670 RepID=UPI0027E54ED2|nr:SH3 domain-containing protein [Vibrio parahaemolyticus]MDS1911627.1 SH3 domain-containing protein [Vibrio parahaemolyticus]WMN64835.1 SH3 domain-containing protein [Vibrio parahaemolyticus]WMN75473.1 SH3 domain-containing protein [Vibrio parahaemolyticus]